METVPEVRFRLRGALVVAIFIIVGLLFLIGSVALADGFWKSLSDELATAFLISGVVSLVYELLLRRDFIKLNHDNTQLILDKINLSEESEALGLLELLEDSGKYDYSDLIERSAALEIAMNDGRTWVSVHSDKLRQRFRDPEKQTSLYILHPESPMLAVLARKTGTTTEGLESKIRETIDMLHELRGPNTQLSIYAHYLYNPHSIFLGDTYVAITPYFTSRGRRTVPLFRFSNTSSENDYYSKILDDLHALRYDADQLS